MNKIKYLGLIVFYIVIALFFIKSFKPNCFSSIDDIYIDIMWPLGLLICAGSKFTIDKKK